MPLKAPQIHVQSLNETRNHSVSFVGKLDTGEILTGAPTVTELDTTDLTISNEQVSTAALTINGDSVAIGEAVQYRVVSTGATKDTLYRLQVVCGTDAGQTVDTITQFWAR